MTLIDQLSAQNLTKGTTDNLILIDKPAGWTSFDVVKKVRSLTRIKKVGHSGTLDPFATGLLIIGTGKETKNLTKLSQANKSYLATIVFGKKTDTYDCTGEVVDIKPLNDFTSFDFDPLLSSFLGENEQTAPMYSAKKINGKRLYKLARKGIDLERKPHKIFIHMIKKVAQSECSLTIYIECSKGTYIRSLANDLGERTGFGAFLNGLRRIKIGNFRVEQALTLDSFEQLWKNLA